MILKHGMYRFSVQLTQVLWKASPKDVKEVEARNLVYLKNLFVDMSIHMTYVEAIRSAQHFIYIENQYFIGSSYNWSAHKGIGTDYADDVSD